MEALIAFSTSDKLYAKILRKLMNSPIHHTFLFVNLDRLNWMALEIDDRGIRFVPVSKIQGYAKHLKVYECTSTDLVEGLVFMRNYIGKKYDYLGLISGAFRLFLRKYFNYVSSNNEHNPNKMFCSEFVASVIQYSEVEDSDHWIPSNMSPKDLYDFVRNHKDFKEM